MVVSIVTTLVLAVLVNPCKNTFEALTSNHDWEANNKLWRALSAVPSPIINALWEVLATLYWPIVNWYWPKAIVLNPSAWENWPEEVVNRPSAWD